MKILVLQLARLGDIYQTWPTLNSILRNNSDAEVHLVVRERFAAACEGLDPRVKLHVLKTASLLEPVYSDCDVDGAIENISKWVCSLQAEHYDRIVNLSFSPFSSYLTSAIKGENTVVSGYERHTDGFLAIPDDGSAYFYAQVGIERHNRFHLSHLFAHIAGVALEGVDWHSNSFADQREELNNRSYVCLHVGASQQNKSIPEKLIFKIVEELTKNRELTVVLVGSKNERSIFDNSLEFEFDSKKVVDLVGKTTVPEVAQVISEAFAVIGSDSFAMHVASLSGVPCLNLSCQSVNFWETGPVSKGSIVLWKPSMEQHELGAVISAFD